MVIAELVKVTRSWWGQKTVTPKNSLLVQGKGLGGGVVSAEMFQQVGISARPPEGSNVIVIPVGEGRREMYAFAGRNYNVTVYTGAGEVAIYSTTSDGKTVKAMIYLDNNGLIQIENSSKSLYTILNNLISHIQSLAAGTCVSGAVLTSSPAAITNLTQDAADLAALLKA
jgi:phage gp45-like